MRPLVVGRGWAAPPSGAAAPSCRGGPCGRPPSVLCPLPPPIDTPALPGYDLPTVAAIAATSHPCAAPSPSRSQPQRPRRLRRRSAWGSWERRPLGRLRRHHPVLPLHHRRQSPVGEEGAGKRETNNLSICPSLDRRPWPQGSCPGAAKGALDSCVRGPTAALSSDERVRLEMHRHGPPILIHRPVCATNAQGRPFRLPRPE